MKTEIQFNIKLDFCPQGLDWVNLVRVDCEGPSHPDYIDEDGKLLDEIKILPTPHVHFNSEIDQVVFQDKLEYTTAYDLSKILDTTKSYKDEKNNLFELILPKFVEKVANIDCEINPAALTNPEIEIFNREGMTYLDENGIPQNTEGCFYKPDDDNQDIIIQ